MSDKSKKPVIRNVKLGSIIVDQAIQSRARIDQEAVADYAANIENLPPGKAIEDPEGSIYLYAGFHRLHAHIMASAKNMELEITSGTRRDAILLSAAENAANGVHRSAEDKRRSVLMLLNDEEWVNWSNRVIADKCNVSHDLVNRIRSEMFPDKPTAVKSQDGKTRSVTTNRERAEEENAAKSTQRGDAAGIKQEVAEAAKDIPAAAAEPLLELPEKDKTGTDIKSKAVAEIFGQDILFVNAKGACRQLKKELLELAESKSGKFLDCDEIDNRIKDLYNLIEFGRPYAECPYCIGKKKPDCKSCRKTGFVNKFTYNSIPEEIRGGATAAPEAAPADPVEKKKNNLPSKKASQTRKPKPSQPKRTSPKSKKKAPQPRPSRQPKAKATPRKK